MFVCYTSVINSEVDSRRRTKLMSKVAILISFSTLAISSQINKHFGQLNPVSLLFVESVQSAMF